MLAELADNTGRELLIVLAQEMGQEEMVAQFQRALSQEGDHLLRVQDWLRRGTVAVLGGRGSPVARRTATSGPDRSGRPSGRNPWVS